MKDPNRQIGSRIKAARMEKKLTQEKLAEIINISTTYVSEIESKGTVPSTAILFPICKFLNVSIDDIIFDTTSDSIRKLTRKLSQCSEKQLELISSLVDAVLQVDIHD